MKRFFKVFNNGKRAASLETTLTQVATLVTQQRCQIEELEASLRTLRCELAVTVGEKQSMLDAAQQLAAVKLLSNAIAETTVPAA